MSSKKKYSIDEKSELVADLQRYFSFWPYYVISLLFFIISAYLYLRYTTYTYEAAAKIEILDKSQESEMSLPTAMTIFNRSMVNLENEIGVITSRTMHLKTVSKLKSYIRYFTIGTIKTTENHKSEWFKDYEFELNSNRYENGSFFEINIEDDSMIITGFDYLGNEIMKYTFNSLSTEDKSNKLPFKLKIKELDLNENYTKRVFISDSAQTTSEFQKLTIASASGKESDQLNLSIIHPNIKIAEEYLNNLINEFDNDGIADRQLEYKRTIDFVNSRSEILQKELEIIELKKQKYKEDKNLTDIKSDASLNITQKFSYSTELFQAQSQQDLLQILKETLLENKYNLVPVNIGIENAGINNLINEYNLILKQRDKFLASVGPENIYLKNLNNQITDIYDNIILSIEKYEKELLKLIKNLESKENEFAAIYKSIPENEKILRSIERELEIKEALFLLLLQKKEEASINYAVVKPSIKIIDPGKANEDPVNPNKIAVYFIALAVGFAIPFSLTYIKFALNTKIHTRDDLNALFDNEIPILAEIPHIENSDEKSSLIKSSNDRSTTAESFRILSANSKFLSSKKSKEDQKCKTYLVTSTLKGEGKTFIATNFAASLCKGESKVLLIGCDLRNPQIHKFFDKNKNSYGVSDYIYLNKSYAEVENKLINKNITDHKNFDIIFSGSIPPNPTELLASLKFKNLIDQLKNVYDFIIIDSAPCLLVSDTFEISKYTDSTIYVVRSNFSDVKVAEFISDTIKENKLNDINLVLNGVGNSREYGYKYGYQYGYKYRYRYNYGYGYGYSQEKER